VKNAHTLKEGKIKKKKMIEKLFERLKGIYFFLAGFFAAGFLAAFLGAAFLTAFFAGFLAAFAGFVTAFLATFLAVAFFTVFAAGFLAAAFLAAGFFAGFLAVVFFAIGMDHTFANSSSGVGRGFPWKENQLYTGT